jgi:hypothetical protein
VVCSVSTDWQAPTSDSQLAESNNARRFILFFLTYGSRFDCARSWSPCHTIALI